MRKYDENGESSPRETDAVAATMGPLYSPSIHYTSFLHYTPLLHIVLFLYIILYFYPIYSPFIHYTHSLHTLLFKVGIGGSKEQQLVRSLFSPVLDKWLAGCVGQRCLMDRGMGGGLKKQGALTQLHYFKSSNLILLSANHSPKDKSQ